MKNKQTRKNALHERATRYHQAREEKGGANGFDCWLHWKDGYRAALKDVRKAVGKCGIPSRLVKLLQPIR